MNRGLAFEQIGRYMMTTAQDVYAQSVVPLPASERLRLATMILEGLSGPAAAALDFSDQWSDEDLRDVSAFAADRAADEFGQE
jgi:hypothetical protein